MIYATIEITGQALADLKEMLTKNKATTLIIAGKKLGEVEHPDEETDDYFGISESMV